MLEGGATLAGAFIDAGEVDELRLFLAPLIVGGDAPPLLRGTEQITEAIRPIDVAWEKSGDDMLARARLKEW